MVYQSEHLGKNDWQQRKICPFREKQCERQDNQGWRVKSGQKQAVLIFFKLVLQWLLPSQTSRLQINPKETVDLTLHIQSIQPSTEQITHNSEHNDYQESIFVSNREEFGELSKTFAIRAFDREDLWVTTRGKHQECWCLRQIEHNNKQHEHSR